MAKIYSLVAENDSGSETLIFYTEAERNARALAIVAEEWDADLGPMPDDWWEAYEALHNQSLFDAIYLHSDDHEIDPAKLEN